MKYALGNMLGGGMIGGLDASAKAYINTIVSAGATVTSTQRDAINTFYKSAKTDGYYNQVKRLYLPIWSVASPNAVDMISATSGTFSGTLTHGAGFVQGNGSTGRFLMNASPNGVGMVAGSSSTFVLTKSAQASGFNAPINSTPTGLKGNGFAFTGITTTTYYEGRTSGFNVTANPNGIIISSEIAADSRYLRRRTTSGVTALNTNTDNITGSFATFNMSVMAGQSANNSFFGYSTGEYGAYGIGLALTTTQADAFTAALKTLWETCTGLTLP